MIFRKNHQRENNSEFNGFKPARLVYIFKKIDGAIETDRGHLPTKYNAAQNIIQNRIESEESERSKLTNRGNIKNILAEFELKDRLPMMKTAYEQLNKPIKDAADLKDAVINIDSFSRIRRKLNDENLGEKELNELREIGLSVYFDQTLNESIDKAFDRVFGRIKIKNILCEASYKQQAKKEMSDQLTEDQVDIEYKIRKRAIELSEEGKSHTGKILDYKSKNEITLVLLNAEFLRKQQIQKYLQDKRGRLDDQFSALAAKSPSRLENRIGEEIQQRLESYRKILADKRLLEADSSNYKNLDERLDFVSSIIEDLDKKLSFIDGYAEDPEKFSQILQKKINNIKTHIANYSPQQVSEDKIKAELSALDEAERERIKAIPEELRTKFDIFGESSIYKKNKAKILAQKEGAQYREIVKSLNEKKSQFDDLSTEDKSTFIDDLDGLNEKLGAKYDILREKIKGLNDAKEIKKNLRDFLGDDHVDFIDDSHFRNYGEENLNLNDFTIKGGMVFYEKGKDWKIVINEDKIRDNIEVLKKQLNHELLHLEFENNEGTKNKWRDLFTNHHHWKEIKKSFLEAFPDKKAPEGGSWKDDDILSELYAMKEGQIFNNPRENNFNNNSPAHKLNQLIWEVNKDRLGIKDGEEMVKAKVRGYDDAEDASANIEGIQSDEGEGNAEIKSDSGINVGSANENREKIKKADENIKSLLRSPYISHLSGAADLLSTMKSFNQDTYKINDEFDKTNSGYLGATIKDRLKMINDDIKDLNDKIADIGDKMPDEGGNIFRDMWNRTHWFAPEDFWKVGTDVMEWWKRRYERKKGDSAARIGTALADKMPLPWIGEYGMEAQARKEKTEAEEVNEWKSRLENKDAWELIDLLKQISKELMPNPDQLKAILRILADKGRIDWRMPELWTLLSKLQTSVNLNPNDETLLKNPIFLRQKLHKSIGEIYDYDEFLDLERKNESSYDSGKQNYKTGLNKIQDQVGSRLDQLLLKHKNGENVDPQEYEAIIDYCIEDSKAYAEHVMFHIICGIASGLLSPDRGLAIDKDPNQWPATNWITAHKPPLTQSDYKYYAENYFKDDYKNGKPGDSFMDFYWTVLQNHPAIIERTRKSVSDRKWDHDWSRSIAPMGDSNTAKQFLSGRSSQQETKDTAIENSISGAWMWLDKNIKYIDRVGGKKGFIRQISWLAMTDGILSSVAYQNVNTFARFGSILNNKPREGSLSGNDWTTRSYLDSMRNFLDHLDGTFFKMIRDEKTAKENPNEHASNIKDYLLKQYPSIATEISKAQKLDDIFDKMDSIISAIIVNTSDSKFKLAAEAFQSK